LGAAAIAVALSASASHAIPINAGDSLKRALAVTDLTEEAAYIVGGRRYCFYFDGWHGAGDAASVGAVSMAIKGGPMRPMSAGVAMWSVHTVGKAALRFIPARRHTEARSAGWKVIAVRARVGRPHRVLPRLRRAGRARR
jgi:hypothetical protein